MKKRTPIRLMVNPDTPDLDIDGDPLIAVYMAHPRIVEGDEGDLVPGMTISPAAARILAQALLDAADEAELRWTEWVEAESEQVRKQYEERARHPEQAGEPDEK